MLYLSRQLVQADARRILPPVGHGHDGVDAFDVVRLLQADVGRPHPVQQRSVAGGVQLAYSVLQLGAVVPQVTQRDDVVHLGGELYHAHPFQVSLDL